MKDKIVLITGASSGIGRAASIALARSGAHIVMLCRNPEKPNIVKNEIARETGKQNVDIVPVDLANLGTIRKATENVASAYPEINVLINNAGGFFSPGRLTSDGFEYTFGTNHLGPFLLTNLLLKKAKWSHDARIINLSSEAQRQGKIYFADLMGTKHYSAMRAYCQSKLANILFTLALAERIKDRGITVNAVHPGVVRTRFGSEAGRLFKGLIVLARPFMRSPVKGAETVVYLAESQEVSGVTGKYFTDKKPIKMNPIATDNEAIERLWKVSCELTGFKE
jgi:retinol dehydrogenase-14